MNVSAIHVTIASVLHLLAISLIASNEIACCHLLKKDVGDWTGVAEPNYYLRSQNLVMQATSKFA